MMETFSVTGAALVVMFGLSSSHKLVNSSILFPTDMSFLGSRFDA